MKTVFKRIFSWLMGSVVALGLGLGLSCSLNFPVRATDFAKPQALLAQRFHSSERVTFVKVRPDDAQREALKKRLGHALPKPEYTFFVATSHGKPDGYALFDEQIGQHEPISFATFFDAQGQITDVEVVAYREPFGDGIRAERFRKQFVGRGAHSQYRSGTDIDTISGATISSRSMCVGVERAAVLFEITMRGNGSTLAQR